jgi:O-antigen ligase
VTTSIHVPDLQDLARAPLNPAGLTALACVTAIALNHSSIVGGINLSLSDPLILVLAAALGLSGRLMVPLQASLFFVILVVVTSLTGLALTPFLFGTIPDGQRILADLAKLAVCLLFLACGASVARLGIQLQVLRWFALGAIAVASLGVVMEISGVRLFGDLMYYSGIRYKGFMVDPNYWAVLTCAAIAFFIRDVRFRPLTRMILIGIATIALLLSASKTGFITLLALSVLAVVDHAVRTRRSGVALFVAMAGAGLLILWQPILAALRETLEQYTQIAPQLSRLAVLLDDPLGAIGEGGSGRYDTWANGLEIIQASPLAGVGVGSYSLVSNDLFGRGTLAHNTYLQITAEWGLVLAAVFFIWLATRLLQVSTVVGADTDETGMLVLRDMVVVFLIGSISLSLNNARMFWFFLGMMLVTLAAARARSLAGADARGGVVPKPGREPFRPR